MKQQLGEHASHGLPKRAFKPNANLNATDTAALLWAVTTQERGGEHSERRCRGRSCLREIGQNTCILYRFCAYESLLREFRGIVCCGDSDAGLCAGMHSMHALDNLRLILHDRLHSCSRW